MLALTLGLLLGLTEELAEGLTEELTEGLTLGEAETLIDGLTDGDIDGDTDGEAEGLVGPVGVIFMPTRKPLLILIVSVPVVPETAIENGIAEGTPFCSTYT